MPKVKFFIGRFVEVFLIPFLVVATLQTGRPLPASSNATLFVTPAVAEEIGKVRQALARLDGKVPLQELKIVKETTPIGKSGLGKRLRGLYDERQSLSDEILFWKNVGELQNGLLELSPAAPSRPSTDGRLVGESLAIARTAIGGFEELRRRYGMIRPAVLHNFFVNAGLKKEGFCWHWTRDMMKRLRKLDLSGFELRWATARARTVREHNTVVIVRRGRDLEEGILLDGWRKSGRPYWAPVYGDDYPWQAGEYFGEE